MLRRLAPLAASVVNQALTRTATAQQRLVVATRTHVSRATAHLDSAENHVRLLDPVHTLARGWSITRNGQGNVVRSVARLGSWSGRPQLYDLPLDLEPGDSVAVENPGYRAAGHAFAVAGAQLQGVAVDQARVSAQMLRDQAWA